jgi:hypothetical protein
MLAVADSVKVNKFKLTASIENTVRFELLTTVTFWNVTPCSTLKMEATVSPRNLVIFYQSTWLYIPQAVNIHTRNVQFVLDGIFSPILVTRLYGRESFALKHAYVEQFSTP